MVIIMMAMKMNLQFYMRTKKMSIKHKIKFKKVDRDRGTYLANGISLDLSDDGQPSDDSRRLRERVPFADVVSPRTI